MTGELKNPLVFVPTYNERENVERLYREIRKLPVDLDILFLDDHSPDGTGEAIDRLAAQDARVFTIHRKSKLGVGSAHFDGITWAYDHGYTVLVTMDCDFTHPPDKILDVLREKDAADVVVGSRYMSEGSLSGWNVLRKLLTWTGHALTRTLLGMKYDATGAFRLYRLDRIPRAAFSLVTSKGYSFFFESLHILHFNKLVIKEIPITLPPRTYGHSKMGLSEISRSVKLLASTFLTHLVNEERYRVAAPVDASTINPTVKDEQGWDDYWADQKSDGGIAYDLVAAFYRKYIIKRNLNRFVAKYFRPGAKVLHAGCGGGQVDTDITKRVSITGLDISVQALNFYKRTNSSAQVLHGSIFEIPLPDRSVEGLYNLGVMEHFTAPEIRRILKEFDRVLAPEGRLIIFWPPEFGSSVIFLRGVKWVLENVFRKRNVKLHPDEITRVQSKAHVVALFEAAGFRVIRYSFSIRDLFTYCIIVAEKTGARELKPGRDERLPRSKRALAEGQGQVGWRARD
jgi:dolichol-phosphate mannosyltransferase